MTAAHDEKETLTVDVIIPEHADRTTTALFRRTREALIAKWNRCYVCGALHTPESPLEAHHHPIERSIAELIDWKRLERDCRAGMWGEPAALFDWDHFDPADPYAFVDDMRVNGLLLCKAHHTGTDEGIHTMPYPLWLAQRYAREGYQFTPAEVIHHEEPQ